ncbi:MAG: hypothetical protein L0K86_01700 [Actinomycetia bacterium]|nr:hypothetical protein [Actinomycetes bacterium]
MAHDNDGPVVLSEHELDVLRRLEQDLGVPVTGDGVGRPRGADGYQRPPRGEIALALLATAAAILIGAFLAGETAGLLAGLVTCSVAAVTAALVRRTWLRR